MHIYLFGLVSYVRTAVDLMLNIVLVHGVHYSCINYFLFLPFLGMLFTDSQFYFFVQFSI